LLKLKTLFYILFLQFITFNAHAYLGPGTGLGVIFTALGIVVALLFSFISIVYLFLKKVLTKKNKKN